MARITAVIVSSASLRLGDVQHHFAERTILYQMTQSFSRLMQRVEPVDYRPNGSPQFAKRR
jgi:hypothetical protein